MKNSLAKTPFLFLLIPLLAGIILQYYFHIDRSAVIFVFAGAGLMLLSYFVSLPKQYKWRWLFGAGLFLFLIAIGIVSTSLRQSQSAYTFSGLKENYIGIVTDIPQQKQKSIACNIELEGSNKNIVCYFQPGIRSRQLKAGDEIIFEGSIKPFVHFGNPDEFDYPRYMYHKCFAGRSYLYSSNWEATGEKQTSLKIISLQFRKKILDFYAILNLDDDAYSILSALTLGYRDALSDDLKQSFRATGTAHVLAVSGLHAGIIYGVIISIFILLFGKRVRHNRIIQFSIIVILWLYAFITGLSPSVIRAVIMLSIFSIANIAGRKGFTYNTIALAAFFMLIYNPFYLYDLGFQLSFTAVIFIRFLQPYLSNIFIIKNKYTKRIWALFTLSLSAQIGTFPLCLYYFGTFPTYFFISNLFVVPLVSLLIYLGFIIVFTGTVFHFFPVYIVKTILELFVTVLQFLVSFMVYAIKLFENLPYALIENKNISLLSLFLLFAIITSISYFFIHKKVKMMIISLSLIFIAVLTHISVDHIFKKNTLSIYSPPDAVQIEWNIGKEKFSLDTINEYRFIKLNNINFLSVSSDNWKNKASPEPLPIDYLHIVKSDSISLYSLTQSFFIRHVILDSSLSTRSKNKLIRECQNMNIPYYDMREKGFFRINF